MSEANASRSTQSRDGSETRLVLIVPTFPRLSETFIVSKFLGLLDKGWDVHVVCGASPAAEWARFPALEQRAGVRSRIHRGWPHRPRWLAALLIPAAALACLVKQPCATWRYLRRGWPRFGVDTLRRLYLDAPIVAQAPEIVHFEFGALAVGRTYLKDLLGCKLIASFRGYDLNHVGLEDADHYREVWERVDALHLLGEDLWQRARRRGCPDDKPHALIAPALDASAFDPGDRRHAGVAGTPDRPLRVLCVGRLEWTKGYEYAVEAIRLLRDRGVCVECRIVGDGQFLEPVAFARRQLDVEKEVQLLGAVPRDAVREHLLQADVFLHAAVSEGFCNAVIEAQAMMLPVVCSDAGGLSENIADGVTGFVVPRRDPAALAGRLAVLAADPALRQCMAEAGRKRVERLFRIEDQIAAFDRLYRQVQEGS